ncbi:hypothetical protein [Streptomyces sp. NPDC057302]|uniref:hypothetical protein n=1 Tax=Streptomyces sp. NPDC057302 TaxID=3346094 RepID=UPI00362F286B
MDQQPIGPACGNNPHFQLTPGDHQAVAEFGAYLTARAERRTRYAKALATITVGHTAFITVDVEAEHDRADAVIAVADAEQAELLAADKEVTEKADRECDEHLDAGRAFASLAKRTQAWGEQHRDRANRYRARVEAARALHQRWGDGCTVCADENSEAAKWPCATTRALRDAEPDVSQYAPAEQVALLSGAERQFLAFALGLAADRMASRGDEFSSDDEAALERLRRMADEAQQNGGQP